VGRAHPSHEQTRKELVTVNAREHYQQGHLQDAISAALDEVRQHPSDNAIRIFLSELCCFTADLERADRQLDVLAHQNPESAMGVQTFRHLVRAEQHRRDFFAQGRLPEFLTPPSDRIRLHLEASIRIREGNLKEAADVLAQAEEQRPKVSGTCDDKPFADFRDLDDLTASFFEVLTSDGRYFWVPIEDVESAEFEAPARAIDLIWRRTHLIVRDGPDGEVFIPVLYPGSFEHDDDTFRLGRQTDWFGGEGSPVRGVGQRMLLVGEDARSILELKTITIDGNPA
jgi:type VI secretion system protein ImpE